MSKTFIHEKKWVKVFVNGTFDLLHPGHIALLNHAKSLGDYVVVGIDTDDRVKEKKGSTRPIYNQEDRGLMLIALSAVDEDWAGNLSGTPCATKFQEPCTVPALAGALPVLFVTQIYVEVFCKPPTVSV